MHECALEEASMVLFPLIFVRILPLALMLVGFLAGD